MTADRIDVYELNRTLEVWRAGLVDDGQGGQDEVRASTGTVRGKVNEPSAEERIEAQRSGVELTHSIHLLPDADVQRMDELRGDGEVFLVRSTGWPSTRVYLRAQCTRDQSEQGS